MDINEALKALSNGHSIWKVDYAKKVCKALNVPFNKKLIQKFKSDPPGTFKGLVMNPGRDNSEGVDGLDLSDYVTAYFKLTDKAGSFIGRGFQAQANSEVIKQKLLEEGYKANAKETKKLSKLTRSKQIEVIKNADVKFEVKPTVKDTTKMKAFLVQRWCECGNPEFLCYPEDGCCTCGEYKHHVHCKNCGGITQTG